MGKKIKVALQFPKKSRKATAFVDLESPKKDKKPKSHKTRSPSKNVITNSKKRSPRITQYSIPKEKFERALEILRSPKIPDDSVNFICHTSVDDQCNKTREHVKCPLRKLLSQARICLLKRDWINLAKVLATAKPLGERVYSQFFPVFLQYATICLAHNKDIGLMHNFLHTVTSCQSEAEMNQFWKHMTTISTD